MRCERTALPAELRARFYYYITNRRKMEEENEKKLKIPYRCSKRPRKAVGGPDLVSRIAFSRASASVASENACLPLRSDVSRRENSIPCCFHLLTRVELAPLRGSSPRSRSPPKEKSTDGAFFFWWTWRELNSCPKNDPYDFLRGQFAVWISLGARRQTDSRFGSALMRGGYKCEIAAHVHH